MAERHTNGDPTYRSVVLCPHGFPSPASCFECMQDEGLGAEPVAPVVEAEGARPFRARHESTCDGCSGVLRPGEWAIAMSDGSFRHHRDGCSRPGAAPAVDPLDFVDRSRPAMFGHPPVEHEPRWRELYEQRPAMPERCPYVDPEIELYDDGRPARCVREAGHHDGHRYA